MNMLLGFLHGWSPRFIQVPYQVCLCFL